jgi:hypothetical protein
MFEKILRNFPHRTLRMEITKESKVNISCVLCDFLCRYESEYSRHVLTRKHKNRTSIVFFQKTFSEKTEEKKEENNEYYKCCVPCDYICDKKSDYTKHILTCKHKTLESKEVNGTDNNGSSIQCDCGKLYKARNSLWYHKKKCRGPQNKCVETLPSRSDAQLVFSENVLNKKLQVCDNQLIMMVIQQNKELIKQNSELQSDMREVLKKCVTTNNTINNNHKTFNIQLFLNETCKDAMNITDFVDSIKIQISDLDRLGDSGFATGISDIIVKELQSIEVNKRPVHCSDIKRETMYIRDEDKWEKEDTEKQKMQNMILSVSHKNLKMLPQWQEAHPSFHDSKSSTSDRYNRIILGSLDNTKENNEKIIKNIAKEVKI